MKSVTWIVVTCPTQKLAKQIGTILLRERFIACYDVIPRLASGYFWPPKSGTIEHSKGAVLILTTTKRFVPAVYRKVKEIHTDTVPMLATVPLNNVPESYGAWLREELHSSKSTKARSSRSRFRKYGRRGRT